VSGSACVCVGICVCYLDSGSGRGRALVGSACLVCCVEFMSLRGLIEY
jgi:hypothetical protein